MKLIHQQVDWDDYRVFEQREVERTVGELGEYLNKKHSVDHSFKYYFALLYMPLSDMIYKFYLSEKSIYKGQSSKLSSLGSLKRNIKKIVQKKPQMNLSPESYGADSSDIVSMQFFHRHPDYETAFDQAHGFKELPRDGILPIEWQKRDLNIFDSILGSIASKAEIESSLLLPGVLSSELEKQFSTLSYPKAILTNAHGLYSSPAASFYVANAIERDIPIIVNQPGLIHTFLKYINQLEFEKVICTKYLGWSESAGTMDSEKHIQFGSFYSDRLQGTADIQKGTLVVLPQLPSVIKPFSMYYTDVTENGWGYIDSFIQDIVENSNKLSGPVVLRCKNSCHEYYSKKLSELGSDLSLVSGDVNDPNQQYGQYENIVSSYVGTSISESMTKSKNSYFVFGDNNVSMDEQFKNDLFGLPTHSKSFKEFNPGAELSVQDKEGFLKKYAKPVSSQDSAEKLKEIVQSL